MSDRIIPDCHHCGSPIKEVEVESEGKYICLVCGGKVTYNKLVNTVQKQVVDDAIKRIRRALRGGSN